MIKIICLGKIKETYLKEGISEYLKRISKYTKIEIIELADYSFDIKKTQELERNSILKVIKETDYNILLDLKGIKPTSIELASQLEKIRITNSNINFIIGGSFGVHNDIKEKADLKISFSNLTFPHQLFRLILLEQIYRCFKIMNNEEYHK